MVISQRLERLLDYPEIHAHRQNGTGLCGVAAIRSVLDTQFNLEISEKNIVEAIGCDYLLRQGENSKAWDYDSLQEMVKKRGVSPLVMANCFYSLVDEDIKVFCSKQGDINQLNYLFRDGGILPIIHQMVFYPERGDLKPEGHYLLFGGCKDSTVRIFDPSRGEGFKYFSKERFHREWRNKDERWYLAVLPRETILFRERFSGKCL